MAILYFLRHAKSDWGMGLPDHDRPLNERGRLAAEKMGQYLSRRGFDPEVALCSSAQRARETLEILTEAGGLDFPVQIEPDLYGAGTSTILDIVRHRAGNRSSTLLVGHNPGFQDTVLSLAAKGDETALRHLRQKYPTCCFSAIRFEAPLLGDIDAADGTLDQFIRPRDLP